jgi:hypothetical protein
MRRRGQGFDTNGTARVFDEKDNTRFSGFAGRRDGSLLHDTSFSNNEHRSGPKSVPARLGNPE